MNINIHEEPRVFTSVFVFNDDGELLLIKSKKWKSIILPGGKVESGEAVEEAAKRGIKEELGLKLESLEFLGYRENIKTEFGQAIFLIFKARAKNPNKARALDEIESFAWLKPEDWMKEDGVDKNVKNLINDMFINKTEDFEAKYKRALADYQNLLKRTAEEKQEFAKYANESLLHEFLPVYDNLKISMQHIGEGEGNNAWAEGIKYVIKQFKDALSSMGVVEIETVGKKFDPAVMEAVEGRGEIVEKELRPGYKLNGKVIVPAKVVLEKENEKGENQEL